MRDRLCQHVCLHFVSVRLILPIPAGSLERRDLCVSCQQQGGGVRGSHVGARVCGSAAAAGPVPGGGQCQHRQHRTFFGGAGVLHLWADRALCLYRHRLLFLPGGRSPGADR